MTGAKRVLVMLAMAGSLLLSGCGAAPNPITAPTAPPTSVKSPIPAPKVTPHRTIARPHHTKTSMPSAGGAPFRCKDGTVSHAAHRRGACSHHGGIA